ncbi:MAG: sodium/proline symporter PutP [Clostridia bacterium]|nr:sodium/proline symporter PutP [Clostridia bacterium]
MNWELTVLIIYFVAMLGIGVSFFLRSKVKNDKDYFLGGKAMGPWVTAMSAQASDMSAWLLMGLPGSILAFGLGQAWIGIGLALGTALNWILIARRLRRFSEAANDSITLPQYLSNRFVTKSKTLQVVCAVVFLVCFTVYVASAFVAGTSVFTSLFPNIKESVAMLIFALILIVYTFLGGYKAVCWTDFVQGLLMLVAVLAVPIIIVCTRDLDYTVLDQVVKSADGETSYTFIKNIFAAPAAEIASGLAWGLGYFGMPHILVRFMSIKKPSMVKTSATVAITWVVLALGAVIFIALFGRVMIGSELLPNGKQSMVFVELARDLFPPAITGVLLSAIIAASMSTADSQLLVASSSFTSDIYKPLIRKNASEKETLWIGRAVVLVVSVVAYFIASSKGQGAQAIMNLVENAWAGFGSAFGSVIILSLFWRRFTYKGALAGVVAGALTDVLWLIFLSKPTGIYEIIPGFIVSMIAAVVVTLLDKQPAKEITDIYDAATAPCEE